MFLFLFFWVGDFDRKTISSGGRQLQNHPTSVPAVGNYLLFFTLLYSSCLMDWGLQPMLARCTSLGPQSRRPRRPGRSFPRVPRRGRVIGVPRAGRIRGRGGGAAGGAVERPVRGGMATETMILANFTRIFRLYTTLAPCDVRYSEIAHAYWMLTGACTIQWHDQFQFMVLGQESRGVCRGATNAAGQRGGVRVGGARSGPHFGQAVARHLRNRVCGAAALLRVL